MSGAMLVTTDDEGNSSVAHRGEKIARNPDRQFYSRTEGSFAKIIRKGSTPSNYLWEVTDKSGTKHTYGAGGAILKGTVTGLDGQSKEVVAEWLLSRVEETHGDYIEYVYETINEPVRGSLTSKAVYLKEVRAGNKGDNPHTVVTLHSTSQKDKKTNSGRYGFLTSDNKLLDKVDIAFESEILRSYFFQYKSGSFNTNLLEKITHLDSNGEEFASHTLDYYDDVKSGDTYYPFSGKHEQWNLHDDNINAGFINPVSNMHKTDFSDKATALGGSKTTSNTGGMYVGVGIKYASAGGSYSYTQSSTEGLATLIDIDGDGLPDKVYKKGGSLYYRPNLAQDPVMIYQYGDEIKIMGASSFSKVKSKTHTYGPRAKVNVNPFGASTGFDETKTKIETDIYFSDVNNDGLIDIISNGTVYFNHIDIKDGKAVPTFTLSSADTPSPIMGGGNVDISATEVDPEEQEELVNISPLLDVVRIWEAPFSGTIKIEGNVQLQAPGGEYDSDDYDKSDGVRVAIQVAGSEKWDKSIAKGDFSSYAANVSGITITKGQKVYFRLQSGNEKLSNGAFDQVTWSPVITYSDRTNQSNPNGQGTAVYKASETNHLSIETSNYISTEASSKVSGKFVKSVTSDNTTLRAVLSNDKRIVDQNGNEIDNPDYVTKVVYERAFAYNETFDGDIVFNVNNDINGEEMHFSVLSSTNIALEKIRWSPVLEYAINGYNAKVKANVGYTTYATHVFEGDSYNLTQDAYLKIQPQFAYKSNPVLPDATINGNISIAVKNVTGLLAKKEFTITNGMINPGVVLDSIDSKTGAIWVEYYSSDKTLLSKISKASVTINAYKNSFTDSKTIAVNTFTDKENTGFGNMYRGWGQFVYNANAERYLQSINESLLKLPETEEEASQPTKAILSMMASDSSATYWVGPDMNSYIKKELMSSSRLGEQDVILVNPLSEFATPGDTQGDCVLGTGAKAPRLITKTEGNTKFLGASAGVSANLSESKIDEKVKESFADMNGDGYPDLINSDRIQFTNTQGGFDGEILTGDYNHSSHSEGENLGLGGNLAQIGSILSNLSGGSKAGTASASTASTLPPIDVSVDKSTSKEETNYTLIDINGDGLPDKVMNNGKVQLNLGYSFTPETDWSTNTIQKGETRVLSLGAGLGFDKGSSSFSGGFGVTTTDSKTTYTLMDINSDGLPDKIRADIENKQVFISLNTGNSFAPEILWQGLEGVNKYLSTAESANFAVSVNIPVFWILSIILNPSTNAAKTMNRPTMELRDVDGDGHLDRIESQQDGRMNVYRSQIGRTNKLAGVNNPLGGAFGLSYERTAATYNHPGGKWVMKEVYVNDGITDDGANMRTIFEYKDGKQDRHEREFLGFEKVITENIGFEQSNHILHRRATQEYDVNSIYTAGNQLRSIVEDAKGNKYAESVNEYYSYKVTATADNYKFEQDNAICTDRAIAFTPLKYTKSVIYEGQTEGMIANESHYDYYLDGNFGELKSYKYSDKGALGNKGVGSYNYQTQVEYTHNKNKHILGLPVKVQVKGSDGTLFRQVEATYDPDYANHMTKVNQLLNSQGTKAEVDIKYDKYGNITQKTMPANSKGQRMWYKYKYDSDYDMYLERVEDAFGYRSEMEDYDYRFGIPLVSRDMNGYTMETTLDHMGRVNTITGPNEQVLGLPYTIKFEYHPQIEKGNGEIKSPAYAVTKHYDPANPTDDLETVTFVDGMGRPVQVKKDGVITTTDANGRNPQDKKVMIVSGRAKLDALGRVVAAYHPMEEVLGSKTIFNRTFDAITPTLTKYDVMDRAVVTTLPDGNQSTMEYTKDNTNRVLVTTLTDAMGGKQSTFTNTSGLTMKTEQYSGPNGTITTSFAYDAINQLLKAIDHEGNETLSVYDMTGRRTEVNHPASGINKFVFDNAGNLLSKETANLGQEGKVITYDYDFNRLMAITYPNNPDNNVKYHYGNKNAKENRVGCLMLQEDATGAQEFFYDRLGNMERVRRTVIIPNQAITTYITEWKYDSWNRFEHMIYPDGEKVSYAYNTGGLLEAVKGEKAYSYNYVNKIGYDKYEQRNYLKYCNGAETSYSYDPERRRMTNLKVWSKQQIIDNKYSYDKVDNVLSVMNQAPVNTGLGGQMQHNYSYDGLYRLQNAMGTYAGANGKTAEYNLAMGYDNMHRITSKKQHIQQSGIMFDGVLKAGYDLTYAYNGDTPFQLSNLQDENYRTEGTAAVDTIRNENKYKYDANGNLLYVNIAQEKLDGKDANKTNEKKLIWDEENRLQAVSINGFVSTYTYDASGERVVKMSGSNEGIFVNDVFSGGRNETANFTAYVNPYLVVSKGGQYTKHIYIGSQRIVSKMGDLDSYGQDPRRIDYAGAGVDGAKIDYKSKYKQSQQTIKDLYVDFEIPYRGKDNDDYVNGSGFCCDDAPKTKSLKANDNPELFQYYYHPDHLGSTSYVTNLDGDVVQHIEYVPFGEVFLEERNNKWNTPYLFNAKELDEETGLYYYGARYYDPKISLWLSTDPLQEKYPNISTYTYCVLNPVKYIDPDGREIIFFIKFKGVKGTSHIKYTRNGLIGPNGKAYTAPKGSHLERVVKAYDKMLNSGDKELETIVGTLIDSKNEHYVNGTQGGSNSVSRGADHTTGADKTTTVSEDKENAKNGIGMGTQARYNFSVEDKKSFEESTGVKNSDFSTVTHEARHQYDYDQGKMGDSYDKNSSATSPAEIRAVNTENRARAIEKLSPRTKYGGKIIDANKLKNGGVKF